MLLIGPLGTHCNGIWSEILTFSFKKKRLNTSSAKWRPFCISLNVLSWVPQPISFQQIRSRVKQTDNLLRKPNADCTWIVAQYLLTLRDMTVYHPQELGDVPATRLFLKTFIACISHKFYDEFPEWVQLFDRIAGYNLALNTSVRCQSVRMNCFKLPRRGERKIKNIRNW